MHFQHRRVWLPALSLLFSGLACAAGISVNNGGTVNLGDGSLNLNCNELNIAGGSQLSLAQGSVIGVTHMTNNGQLDGVQGSIDFTGNWIQLGNFNSGTGTVNLVDGCSMTTTTMGGSSGFFQFSASTTGTRTLSIQASTNQQVGSTLTLTGSNGNLLTIRSTVTGQLASLDLAQNGSQDISFVDVADIQASGQLLAPGSPASSGSVDSGNTPGWFTALSDDIFSSSFE